MVRTPRRHLPMVTHEVRWLHERRAVLQRRAKESDLGLLTA